MTTEKLNRNEAINARASEALGIILLALSLAMMLSLISYDPLDPSWNVASARDRAINWIGSFGSFLADGLLQIFGLSAFLIPILLTFIGWRTLRLRNPALLRRRFLGLLLLLVSMAGLLSLPQMPYYKENVKFGGALGYLLAALLEPGLNKLGAGIAFSVLLIFSLMLAVDFSINSAFEGARARSFVEWIIAAEMSLRRPYARLRERMAERSARRKAEREAAAAAKAAAKAVEEERLSIPTTDKHKAAVSNGSAKGRQTSEISYETKGNRRNYSQAQADAPSSNIPPSNQPIPQINSASELLAQDEVRQPNPNVQGGRNIEELRRLVYGSEDQIENLNEFPLSGSSQFSNSEYAAELNNDQISGLYNAAVEEVPQNPNPASVQEQPRRRFDTIRVPNAVAKVRHSDPAVNKMLESAMIGKTVEEPEETAVPQSASLYPVSNFALPALKLLTENPPRKEQAEDELWERAKVLAEKCKEFSVSGKIQHINPGPVVTTFEFKPDPGVKYSRVTSLVDDLCLALKAESIRIDRIPGKSTVGIEVPNVQREVIYLREIFESEKYHNSGSPLTLALGKTIDGKTHVADLTRMPHLLIAGATGTGKSVCLNSIIVSILYKAGPEDVKMIMVDPKRLELGLYEGIPHLLTPIVTDPKRASNALKWAVGEMENRYKMLAGHGVRNIEQYNQQIRLKREEYAQLNDDERPRPIPYIVIIIDELADLMMVASNDVEMSITRLAQMARAVGIHLVIATQRPSVDVITGLIKANFPSRISFRVSSKVDSRTILDANGAETLLGQGDMLFLPPGTSRLVRVHGAFVGESEINRIMEHVRSQASPSYDESIQFAEEEIEKEQAGGVRDELYDDALRIICQMGRASTSVLQRRLRIGYGRAAAILDMMEREGFVGPPDGSKPRAVRREAHEYLERLDQI